MLQKKGILLIVLCFALGLFAHTGKGNKTSLNYSKLTSGLHEPTFEGGRTDFVMVDINGNGHVDILSIGDHGNPYINSDQHGIMVWFNDGEGNFSLHMEGNFGYGGIAAGDINNNGIIDIAFGMHHNYAGGGGLGSKLIEAALNDGTGMNWTAWSDGLATNGETWGMFGTDLGDVNNNGLLDLVSISFGCCAGHHVYLNQGNGSWEPSFGLLGGNSDNLIRFGDFNNNGYLDYVAGHAFGTAFFGDGQGDFVNNDTGLPGTSEFGYFYGISVGDVNNDGSHGIAFTTVSGAVKVFEFDADNELWVDYSGNLPTSSDFRMTQLFDMNADGNTDLVVFGGGTVRVYLGDGQGNWTPDAVFYTDETPGNARALTAGGDLTQNGYGDVVLLSYEGAGFWWNYKNEFYVFAETTEPDQLWIKNLYPKGNETFYPGAARFIHWASAVPGNATSYVKIELSANGPYGPWELIADNLPNNGRHQWHIPNHASENCYLKLTVITDDETAVQIMEVPFRILGDNDAQEFNIVFNITNIHDDYLDNAIITIDGIEHEPGHYQFLLEAGSYQYSVAKECYIAAEGELVVAANMQVDLMLNNLKGDANGDGIVNVLDVISVVNHYLELNPEPFCPVNADANMDGIINVLDIIEIVSLFSKAY